MTHDELQQGQIIADDIKITENGIATITEMINALKTSSPSYYGETIKILYGLDDKKVYLNRSKGNLAILELVKTELEKQLEELQKEFEVL